MWHMTRRYRTVPSLGGLMLGPILVISWPLVVTAPLDGAAHAVVNRSADAQA
jgi:hypothetical protein